MNPLIEEAKGVMEGRGKGKSFRGFPDNSPMYIKHLADRCHDLFGMLEKVTAALETAEKRADKAESEFKQRRMAHLAAVERIAINAKTLDAIRAILPTLKALDAAGKRATEGKWGWFGNIETKDIYSINHPDVEFILIAANSRPAIAEAVRILEGGE